MKIPEQKAQELLVAANVGTSAMKTVMDDVIAKIVDRAFARPDVQEELDKATANMAPLLINALKKLAEAKLP